MTLKLGLQLAFSVAPYQISGPSWIDSERYDLVATMPPTTPQEEILEMLQNLLIERFQIRFHREQKEESAYVLVVGRKGTNLTTTECLPSAVVKLGSRRLEATSRKMRDLAGILMRWVDRPVVDMTGLTGCFNFALDFGDEGANAASAAAALEQIGLRLESRKTPIGYLIVDRAEKIPIVN